MDRHDESVHQFGQSCLASRDQRSGAAPAHLAETQHHGDGCRQPEHRNRRDQEGAQRHQSATRDQHGAGGIDTAAVGRVGPAQYPTDRCPSDSAMATGVERVVGTGARAPRSRDREPARS